MIKNIRNPLDDVDDLLSLPQSAPQLPLEHLDSDFPNGVQPPDLQNDINTVNTYITKGHSNNSLSMIDELYKKQILEMQADIKDIKLSLDLILKKI